MSEREKFPSEAAERFQVRLPDGMRQRIKAAADSNGRSMNAEIVAALEEKYPAPSPEIISSETAFQIYIKWRDGSLSKVEWDSLSNVSRSLVAQLMIFDKNFYWASDLKNEMFEIWECGREDARNGRLKSNKNLIRVEEIAAWKRGYEYEKSIMKIEETGEHPKLREMLGKNW